MSNNRTIGMALVAIALALAAGPRSDAAAPAVKPASIHEVDVVAVYLDSAVQAPKVVLERKHDRRRFEMVIGLAEMNGIAIPLNGVTPPRPLTHDLFLTLFGRLKVTLTRVVITDLRDDIYYALLHFTSAAGQLTLDSRPSDAIALAVRAKVPVFVDDRVFEKAGSATRQRRQSI
ncbi:MAG TPA: bifunctional nuclease family protein [Methylomirabilota bacterium]|nr:bifunctional nuclease family protein [Methylomirabilota bacterium]